MTDYSCILTEQRFLTVLKLLYSYSSTAALKNMQWPWRQMHRWHQTLCQTLTAFISLVFPLCSLALHLIFYPSWVGKPRVNGWQPALWYWLSRITNAHWGLVTHRVWLLRFVVIPLHNRPPPTFIIIFPARPKVRWRRGDWGERSEWRAWGQSPWVRD